MADLIKIAVVSDIHAFGRSANSHGSLLDYTGATSIPPPNPLRDLIETARATKLKADVLVCAGDISNRADPAGLQHAWSDLHKLAEALGNAELIATNGNHDLDSRFLMDDPDPDPKGALLRLEPAFPFVNPILSNQYWARNFAIVNHNSGVVFAVLNTSAYHGGKQEEIEHGRVSKRTIEELAAALENTMDARAHVLVCHHHPLPLRGWDKRADREFIQNGQELLNGILKATGTSWLVVHGHRHLPELVHGASTNNDVPFVFGAGSLGARMTGVPNQFHLLTLHQPPENDHASLTGTVKTLQWTDSMGWCTSRGNDGLPAECGFGYRGQVKRLLKSISALCQVDGYAKWGEVQTACPGVRFLIPESLRELETELEKAGLGILRDGSGKIVQVGK
jgi:3',5'-cyclic AMP phosphodiesterase CpdA